MVFWKCSNILFKIKGAFKKNTSYLISPLSWRWFASRRAGGRATDVGAYFQDLFYAELSQKWF